MGKCEICGTKLTSSNIVEIIENGVHMDVCVKCYNNYKSV